MIKFINLNDSFHDPIVNVPGLLIQYNKRTKLAMAVWAIIFASPFLLLAGIL